MPSLILKPMHKAAVPRSRERERVAEGRVRVVRKRTNPVGRVSPMRAAFQWWPSARTSLWEAKDSAADLDKEIKQKFSIEMERQTNKKFIAAFEEFCSLCLYEILAAIPKQAVNLFSFRRR